MISFVSAADAVRCAMSIQQAFQAYNEEEPEEKMFVRIGISAGEPVQEDGDLFGTTVQLAARLCGAAPPGGTLAAEVVKSECAEEAFPFEHYDTSQLKGFDETILTYQVG